MQLVFTMASSSKGEGPIWYRQLVMENYVDGKKAWTDREKTAGPSVLEFYEIIGEELEKELEELQARFRRVEVQAPGSPKHIDLLRLYLDKLDEKIEKGVKDNMDISTRTIETLVATNTIHREFIDKLERTNKELRGYIIALEATNNRLRQALKRDATSTMKEPTYGIE